MYLWNPWSIFDELQHTMASSAEWPQFDIEDSEDDTVLTADVPGMREDEIEIIAQGRSLIVRGERKATDGRYLRRRRFAGSFERRFHVTEGYDLEHVTASLQDGVLTIRLDKTAKAKPRRIPLTSVVDKVKGLLGGRKEMDQAA
jgi:HSP20 family protein